MKTIFTIIPYSLLVILTSLPTMGRAVTTITSLPYTISASGHYELTGNFTANGTDVIVLTAPNVVINLNGFSLNGTNNAGTAVDAINATNVTVHGGTIS